MSDRDKQMRRLLDEWNDTVGMFPKHSSYYGEVLSLLDAAYDAGVDAERRRVCAIGKERIALIRDYGTDRGRARAHALEAFLGEVAPRTPPTEAGNEEP